MPKIIAISGEIGWDVYPEQIRAQIEEAENNEALEFHISSPGGYIYDGLEIFNLIRNYEGETTTFAVGMAASMASYLLMAGDTKKAASNAIFMIHNARGYTGGDHVLHRKRANVLEGMSKLLGQEYTAQTGKTKEAIAQLMDDETYLFGNEILESGFVDEIVNVEADQDAARDDMILDAMVKVEAMVEKLNEKPEDFKKIAAILYTEKPKEKPKASDPLSENSRSSAKIENPNEENHMDPKTMTLAEFLAQNSGAKTEHQKALDDAKAEGNTEGIAAKQAEIDRIHPLISAEGASQALIESGFKALKGESSVDSFVAIADYETRVNEKAKADAADDEAEGDIIPDAKKTSTDGKIRTADDVEAEKALFNKMKGKKEVA